MLQPRWKMLIRPPVTFARYSKEEWLHHYSVWSIMKPSATKYLILYTVLVSGVVWVYEQDCICPPQSSQTLYWHLCPWHLLTAIEESHTVHGGVGHLPPGLYHKHSVNACWLVILFTGVSLKATDSCTKKQAARFCMGSPVCGTCLDFGGIRSHYFTNNIASLYKHRIILLWISCWFLFQLIFCTADCVHFWWYLYIPLGKKMSLYQTLN